MPTYEYLCTACDNHWEEVQRISESPVETCPKCGKSTAKRQISAGNFILKGGGWYADSYSSPSPKKETKGGDGKDAGSATSNGDAKGEKGEKKSTEGSSGSTSGGSTPSKEGSSSSGGSSPPKAKE